MQIGKTKDLLFFLKESLKKGKNFTTIRKEINLKDINFDNINYNDIDYSSQKYGIPNDIKTVFVELFFEFKKNKYKLNIEYVDVYDKNIDKCGYGHFLYRSIKKVMMNGVSNLLNEVDYKKEVNSLLFIFKIIETNNQHFIPKNFLYEWSSKNGNKNELDYLILREYLNKDKNKYVKEDKLFKIRSDINLQELKNPDLVFSNDMEYVFWLDNEIISWEGGIINLLEEYSKTEFNCYRTGNFSFLAFTEYTCYLLPSMFLRRPKSISILKNDALKYEAQGYDIVRFNNDSRQFLKYAISLFYKVFFDFFYRDNKTICEDASFNEVFDIINSEFDFDIIDAPEGSLVGSDLFVWCNDEDENRRFVLCPIGRFKFLLIRRPGEISKFKIEKITEGKYSNFYIKNFLLKPDSNFGILVGHKDDLYNNKYLFEIIEELKKPLTETTNVKDLVGLSYESYFRAILDNNLEKLIKEIKDKTGENYIELYSIV